MSDERESARRWLVVWGDPHWPGATECVCVEAVTEEEAAQLGIEALFTECKYDTEEDLRALSVVATDHMTVYVRANRAERAVLQCCGGLGDDMRFGGHTAVCPERTEPADG